MMIWKFASREHVLDFVAKNFGEVKGLPKEAFLDWIESVIETGVVEGDDDGYKRAMVLDTVPVSNTPEDIESAYDDGYSDGHSDGHSEGQAEGREEGYEEAQQELEDKYKEGREEGYEEAQQELEDKYNEGYQHGVDSVRRV